MTTLIGQGSYSIDPLYVRQPELLEMFEDLFPEVVKRFRPRIANLVRARERKPVEVLVNDEPLGEDDEQTLSTDPAYRALLV